MPYNRFSISVPDDIESKLDELKRQKFYNTSRNAMVIFLIREGLQRVEEKKQEAEHEER